MVMLLFACPSARKLVGVSDNVHVVDWPTDARFIKNTAYKQCGLPGEAWDEHANCREDESGWLCAYHAHGDKSVPPTATVADLWDVGKWFDELNARQQVEEEAWDSRDEDELDVVKPRLTFDEDELMIVAPTLEKPPVATQAVTKPDADVREMT